MKICSPKFCILKKFVYKWLKFRQRAIPLAFHNATEQNAKASFRTVSSPSLPSNIRPR